MVSVAAIAGGHNHISQSAYWEDATASASLSQAQQQQFTPYDGVLSRGYTASAVWVQLEITPLADATPEDQLILRIRPVYLDEVTLFDPLDRSGKERKTGDQTELRAQEYSSLSHTFAIPAGTQPRTIWLRLKTTSTTLMHVEAFSQDEMRHEEHRLLLSCYLSLSLIMVFLIVVLINWINYREFLYAAFVIRNLIYLVYTAAFFGLHRFLLNDWLDAHFLDQVYNWLVVGTTAFSFWFETRFLSEYEPPAWVRHVFHGMTIWSCTAIVLLYLGYTQLALHTNMMLNGGGILIMLFLSLIFIDDKKLLTHQTASLLKKKFVVAYYLIITALLLFSVLPYLGKMAGSEFSANGLVYYALISGLDMTILMQLRANQLRKANIRIAQDLLLSTQEVKFEKIRRQEQSQLLSMLMHELKNPLAVIDMALNTPNMDQKSVTYASRAVTDMKAIIDRCVEADQIDDGSLGAKQQVVHLPELIHELLRAQFPQAPRLHLDIQSVSHITSDQQYLQIILGNLIDNALRYSEPDTPIDIIVTTAPNEAGAQGVSISIANRPGVASWPEADKVFHKYYRSTGALRQSGTGLGLFLVSSLAKRIGASCRYAPDQTCVRFVLWLPI